MVQSEVGTNWFEGGTLIPGEGLGRAPAGLLALGSVTREETVGLGLVLQAILASVSVVGVFGGAPGGTLDGAASGTAHFLS